MSEAAETHHVKGGLPKTGMAIEDHKYLYRQEGQMLPRRVTPGSPTEGESEDYEYRSFLGTVDQ